MLTTQTPRATSTHGVTESTQFSIKANGKAFKVLIDGLYSDKVRAVIRELWTNAYDAHIMAGNADVPFECHLPTVFDPVFRVRDFGVGMSHDQIMHLYTTVFESSKEDSNTQVGKLGLGSKSPFAYTDTFTVTAWDGTTKRSYSAYIGSDYIPRLAVMGSEPNTEPRGIEVSFPTKPGDSVAFVMSAQRTALGFIVPPKMTGNKITIPDMSVTASGTGWALVTGAPWGTHAHARQGCVVYPIDYRAVPGLTSAQQQLLQSSLFIDFPIGDLEISASRESLGYDEATKNNIRQAVIRIESEIVADIQKQIDDTTSMWRAAILLRKLLKGLDMTLGNVVRANIKYKGKPIEASINLRNLGLKCLGDFATFEQGAVRVMYLNESTMQRGVNYGRRSSLKWEPSTYGNIMLGETTILVEDSDTHVSMPSARIRHWYDTTVKSGNVLWVKGRIKGTGIARLLLALGRPDAVVNIADLPKPPKDPSKPSKRSVVKMKKLLQDYKWVDTDVVEEDENIYVHMTRGTLQGPPRADGTFRHVTLSDLVQAKNLLIKLGYMAKDADIIAVPATHKNVPTNNDETWTCLWDLVKRGVDEHFNEAEAAKARAYSDIMQKSGGVNQLMRTLVADMKFGGFDHLGPATTLFALWSNASLEADKLSKINDGLNLAILFHGEFPIKKPYTVDFSKETGKFLVTYPLVNQNLSEWAAPDLKVTKNIVDYVNLVDAAMIRVHNVIYKNTKVA